MSYIYILIYIHVDVSVLYSLLRLKVLQDETMDVMNLKGLRFEAKINIRCSSNHWTLSGHFTKTFAM